MRSAIKRYPDPLAIALAILLSLLLAAAVFADHDRRGGYDVPYSDRYGDPQYGDSRYDGPVGGFAAQAARLDDAAYEAYRLSERRSFASLNESFRRFAEATERFCDSVGYDGRSRGEFDLVVRRYYELRGEFRHYDGPRDLRAAFHRINTPMERLYRSYTGRDLYRDDPNARHGHRGARSRDPHHDRGPDVRPRDRGGHHRGHDGRRGAGRTRGRGHYFGGR